MPIKDARSTTRTSISYCFSQAMLGRHALTARDSGIIDLDTRICLQRIVLAAPGSSFPELIFVSSLRPTSRFSIHVQTPPSTSFPSLIKQHEVRPYNFRSIPMNAAPLLGSALKAASEELFARPIGGGYASLPGKEAEGLFAHSNGHHGRSESSTKRDGPLELFGGAFGSPEHFKNPFPQTHAKFPHP
ncbi:hypothetical protein BC629DRAFT_1436367 [Irpex lacteus]|nr:hypothetical protein BC629DRAFT_1436367 [Irpex lacteus]